jgi:hypothetical protein
LTDFVINSTDAPTLQAAAQAMGFWSTQANSGAGDFIRQGHIPGDADPLSSYFLNIVGAVPGVPGYWTRLRINGSNPFAAGLLTIPPTLTVYSLVEPADGSSSFWSSDGVTPAPAVASIGVIA